jgi:hypothetical protein
MACRAAAPGGECDVHDAIGAKEIPSPAGLGGINGFHASHWGGIDLQLGHAFHEDGQKCGLLNTAPSG